MAFNISKLLEGVIPQLIKKYLVGYVLKAVGIAGGFWTFIVTNVLMKAWKAIDAFLITQEELAAKKAIDDANQKKLEENKKPGVSDADKIKNELDWLNRNTPH